MTRPKPQPLPTPDLQTQSSLSIATNLLLRCEHFFRSLAFLEQANAEDPRRILTQIHSLCRDFHETLFIIDQTLYRHRMQHSKPQRKRRGHHEGAAEEQEEEKDDEGYRVLSEINEQITDYAFLAGHRIHPWDVPYSFISTSPHAPAPSSSKTTSFGSYSATSLKMTTTTAAKLVIDNPVKFPPATWKNRELRRTTTPLAGFRLEDRSIGED
jgi:hypothetical protein